MIEDTIHHAIHHHIIGTRESDRTRRILHAVLVERVPISQIAAREGVSRQRVYYLRDRAMEIARSLLRTADISSDIREE
jgi:DNA-directed RNA polymerase specialized sigma subunit